MIGVISKENQHFLNTGGGRNFCFQKSHKKFKKSYRHDSRNDGRNMIGRNKNWTGPSAWMEEFNKKHNPEFFYGNQKKTKEKKTQKKKTSYTESTEHNPVFKVED